MTHSLTIFSPSKTVALDDKGSKIKKIIKIREAVREDIAECGSLVFHSFRDIDERCGIHPLTFSSLDITTSVVTMEIVMEDIIGIVAEVVECNDQGEEKRMEKSEIAGCVFLCCQDEIFGVDLVAVHTRYQGLGIARMMMQELMSLKRARNKLGRE